MKRILITLVVLIMGVPCLFAQKNLPEGYYFKTLPNGLDVLVVIDKSVPIATIEINVKNGAYTESAEYSGLSHFYEHMFFKANKDLPSQEAYIERTKELGISWNGTTSTNRVNYFFTLPSSNLDEGLKFMNSAIRYPLFLEQEMTNEHPVVNGEFQRGESSPEFNLYYEFQEKMWGKDKSRKIPIGDHDVILSATPEKMRTIQQKYYWPNNSLLIVAGDVDQNDVFTRVESIFGDWQPSGFNPFEKYPIPEFKPIKEDIYFVTTSPNAQAPVIYIGWHGPDTRHDVQATYTADVFSTIVNLESSKFSKELVDAGLALEASMYYSTDIYTGPISIRIVPHPEKIKECLAKLEEHINMWDSDKYYTDEQMEAAKNQLAIREKYNMEQTSGYTHSLGYNWALKDLDYGFNYIQNNNKVTRADIKNYVRKYIKDKPRVSGILLSPGMKTAMNINKFEDLLN
ncbi:MAG: insulinase family protein [Ignavibacteria bacterium]|nr:insulinase family protein [Ignavibacteria bacterium]